MYLHQVVAAALEMVDLLVAQALRQRGQLRVLTEEMFAVIAAVLGRKGLELAVHRLREGLRQGTGGVAGKQAVPVRAPHQLDDAPACACEQGFQFVDHAAVAAHRTVQALQVAVDDPNQVVQLFARRQRQRRHALGLVHFAVAEDAPHTSPGIGLAALGALGSVIAALRARGRVQQLSVLQVAHEARLKDRADGAQAHRAGGELPKVRHQPWVRIAAQALGTGRLGGDFLPVMRQVRLAQATFEKSTCVDAGCRVGLEKNQVSAVSLAALMTCLRRTKKVVEAHLKQVGRAGVTGNVAAQFAVGLVGTHHHGQRVPAHQRSQTFFHRQVARKRGLARQRNRVHVRRAAHRLPRHRRVARSGRQHVHELSHPLRASRPQHRLQRVAPLGRFVRIGVHGQARIEVAVN